MYIKRDDYNFHIVTFSHLYEIVYCSHYDVNISHLLLPRFFLNKQRGYCNRFLRSIHLSVILFSYLQNHRTKSNQIWCVSYSHKWKMQQHIFPRSLGPWGGVKIQISLNFNHKVNFKDFYTKLCVLPLK